jgi:subtilase family serine protease
VDFPASSPNVLACGGTKLVASNGKITSEEPLGFAKLLLHQISEAAFFDITQGGNGAGGGEGSYQAGNS